ncbi:MAG TPA: Pecanex-like protein 1 [Actinoplanes sp.]|nr:Pecanex-like protein 1 [Actinoplanes sp.]
MRRSQYRRAASRSPKWFSGRRRIVAAAATLVAFGGIVTVTQVSDAGTRRSQQRALAACDRLEAPSRSRLSTETKQGTYTTNRGRVTQHSDDGASDLATTAEVRARCRQWVMQNVGDTTEDENSGGGTAAPGPSEVSPDPSEVSPDPSDVSPDPSGSGAAPGPGPSDGAGAENPVTPPPGAGLGILTNSCDTSGLDAHDGFQKGDRCVSTQFGEVGAAANNPSLLIVEAPRRVAPNTPFTLRVSTRNLIRDRFLAAGKGGYYVESSVLQGGLVRGHFHTACRMLASTGEAPDPAPVPAFFVATEDSKGGGTPDTVAIQVPGLPATGTAQCASWAGDGSHRIPMMERANQTPAFDAVRIQVGRRG